MGCDIHSVFQKRTGDGWEDIPSKFDEDRHYFLFSVLAGVRNGFGFAGVPTYTPVEPIAEPRGLPEDFVMDGESHPVQTLELMGSRAEWHRAGDPVEVWMGDHSHSWLTADEILAYVAKHAESSTLHTGILSLEEYEAWDEASEPKSYCGGISGRDVKVSVPAEIDDTTTHVSVSWVRSAMEEIDYFTEEVQRLKDEHGEVRFVFGFDS